MLTAEAEQCSNPATPARESPKCVEAAALKARLDAALQAAPCGFRHEIGWRLGGVQHTGCPQERRDGQLLCAHNQQGNAPLKAALTFLVEERVISGTQIQNIGAYLFRASENLFREDFLCHFAALHVLAGRSDHKLSADALADAAAPIRSGQIAAFLRGRPATEENVERQAFVSQREAGEPLRRVARLCSALLQSYIARTGDSHGAPTVSDFIAAQPAEDIAVVEHPPATSAWLNLAAPYAFSRHRGSKAV